MQAGFTNPKGSRHVPPDGWRTGRTVVILRGDHDDITGILRERVSAEPSVNGNRWMVWVPTEEPSGMISWDVHEYAQSSLRLVHPK